MIVLGILLKENDRVVAAMDRKADLEFVKEAGENISPSFRNKRFPRRIS
jgi:hypothetical protein